MSDEVHRVEGTAVGRATDRLHKTEDFNQLADWMIGKAVREIRDRSGNVRAARRGLMDELQNEMLVLKGNSRASHYS